MNEVGKLLFLFVVMAIISIISVLFGRDLALMSMEHGLVKIGVFCGPEPVKGKTIFKWEIVEVWPSHMYCANSQNTINTGYDTYLKQIPVQKYEELLRNYKEALEREVEAKRKEIEARANALGSELKRQEEVRRNQRRI